MPQPPELQRGVALGVVQAELQPPQCARSVAVFTSQPSTYWPLQSSRLSAHEVMLQVELLQVVVAKAVVQARLHRPQCEVLEVRSKSSSTRLSQSLSMLSQAS